MEMIGMRHIENELDELVYDQYGDELDAKDQEIEAKTEEIEAQAQKIDNLNKVNKTYKEKIKQLNEMKDLNAPEARKILNSLILMR